MTARDTIKSFCWAVAVAWCCAVASAAIILSIAIPIALIAHLF